jgi:hypothetical protein
MFELVEADSCHLCALCGAVTAQKLAAIPKCQKQLHATLQATRELSCCIKSISYMISLFVGCDEICSSLKSLIHACLPMQYGCEQWAVKYEYQRPLSVIC